MSDEGASWVCPLCGRIDDDLEAMHAHALREFRDRVSAGEDAGDLFLKHALEKRPRQRLPGEGSVFRFHDASGLIRFGFKFTSPGGRQVLRRRAPNGEIWLTEEAADAALRLAQAGAPEWYGEDGQLLSYGADVQVRVRDQEAVAAFRRDRWKGARESRGLALKELARQAGIDPSQLRRIEQGNESLSLRTVAALTEALGLQTLALGELFP